MVAALGELTESGMLTRMRDRMLRDVTGRRILRERPIVNTTTLPESKLASLPTNSFGFAYLEFLKRHDVTPDSRTEVKYIDNSELSYIMLRYRQIHDFYHTLTGLGITVEEELALKWIEYTQTGLPVALLSGLVGPLRLSMEQRDRFFKTYVPWAVQVGSRSTFMMNIYYEDEELLKEDVEVVRKRFGILPVDKVVDGNPESRFYAPDMICVSMPHVSRYDDDGWPSGMVYAQLICGEFIGDPPARAHFASPQATCSAIAAALTLLSLDIPCDEIAIPMFTAGHQEFFRLHSIDGIKFASTMAVSPVIDTEPVADMFELMRVHAVEMSERLRERPIKYYLTVPDRQKMPEGKEEVDEEDKVDDMEVQSERALNALREKQADAWIKEQKDATPLG
ncbi:Ubiquinone biosynthesis protein [Blyttiomyces sp. JEL0837]|nr:Ubiquinone biosynthesis protein [Blyttiomyces sp. JEL0837]